MKQIKVWFHESFFGSIADRGHSCRPVAVAVEGRAADTNCSGVARRGLTCHEDALDIPKRWKAPRTIVVNSMSDLFHPEGPGHSSSGSSSSSDTSEPGSITRVSR